MMFFQGGGNWMQFIKQAQDKLIVYGLLFFGAGIFILIFPIFLIFGAVTFCFGIGTVLLYFAWKFHRMTNDAGQSHQQSRYSSPPTGEIKVEIEDIEDADDYIERN